jgi:pyruvate dehydrogenase E1 component
VAADVWSVTSYKELHRSAVEAQRWNLLHPEQPPRQAYVTELLSGTSGVYVAASDYMKVLPESIAKWLPGRLISLGTDGFGRSETRRALRDFFEVDHRFVTLAALSGLAQEGRLKSAAVTQAIRKLDIDPNKLDPWTV